MKITGIDALQKAVRRRFGSPPVPLRFPSCHAGRGRAPRRRASPPSATSRRRRRRQSRSARPPPTGWPHNVRRRCGQGRSDAFSWPHRCRQQRRQGRPGCGRSPRPDSRPASSRPCCRRRGPSARHRCPAAHPGRCRPSAACRWAAAAGRMPAPPASAGQRCCWPPGSGSSGLPARWRPVLPAGPSGGQRRQTCAGRGGATGPQRGPRSAPP